MFDLSLMLARAAEAVWPTWPGQTNTNIRKYFLTKQLERKLHALSEIESHNMFVLSLVLGPNPQTVDCSETKLLLQSRGVTSVSKRGTIPRATTQYGGAESLRGAPKSSSNVTSTFFNAVHLLPKDFSFEHGGAKLASCPGPSDLAALQRVLSQI